MESHYPGEKLLDPSLYGFEEYLVLSLFAFVVFVAIKHLIFHTLYFWWYCKGQFYLPDKYMSFITGAKLSQRLLKYVKSHISEERKLSIEKLLIVVDSYFRTKEFAPNLSTEKGKVVDDIIVEYQPQEVLVVGCHVGYVVLQILRSLPQTARIIVVESNPDFILSAKSLLQIVDLQEKVIFLCTEPTMEAMANLQSDYGISKFDFVFLNRVKHGAPSHVPLLKLLEGNSKKIDGYFHTVTENENKSSRKTVILADKVVMPGDPDFLKYVRGSDKYETKYHQMPLEHCSEEIVDGMEMAIYVG